MDLELHQLDLRYEELRSRQPGRESRLLGSLSERGQQTPILVVVGDEADRYIVVDGYKRVRALRRLGQEVIRATRWELDVADALVMEQLMRTADTDSALEQGWLLRELVERFGLSADELSRRFDRSASWVSVRLGLVRELPEQIQQLVRQGAIGAHGAMKYLVPLARANRADCLQLACAVAPLRLGSRQLGVLYTAYQNGESKTRQMVLTNPALVLRAREEARRTDTKQQSIAELILGDLEILGSVACRAHKRMRVHDLALSPQERSDLGRRAVASWGELASLWRRVEKEFIDARPDDQSSHPGAEA